MNIMTYCMPVSIQPKLWALSIYKTTLTKRCLLLEEDDELSSSSSPTTKTTKTKMLCILQLLTKQHASLVPILGKRSGRDVDKSTGCSHLGYPWCPVEVAVDESESETENDNDAIATSTRSTTSTLDVLPECALYILLETCTSTDAGDHTLVTCKVKRVGRWSADYDKVEWLDDDDTSTMQQPLDDSEDRGNVLYTSYLRRHGYL
jgi:flavin reductase (DIM6/NTAB) family NADH-FMN oxidoreductase RutF